MIKAIALLPVLLVLSIPLAYGYTGEVLFLDGIFGWFENLFKSVPKTSAITDNENNNPQLESQQEIEPEQIFQSNPRNEEYYIEKEQSESGLAREPDTEITDEKLTVIQQTWSENDMRRMELNRNKPVNYEQMVISEFESGKLNHISSCHDLNSYYLLYYGLVYGNQWDYSNNKLVTDYLKERMLEIGCEFKEQAELKEKIDAEKQRVDEAAEKAMKELEVYRDNS